MMFSQLLKLVSVGAGMLLVAAGTSACAVDAQDPDPCEGDDPSSCESAATDQEGEDVGTADQEWRMYLRPDLAGFRFQSPYSTRVYMIDGYGYRRWIPSPYTYNNLFLGWNDVGYWNNLNTVPMGPAFGYNAYLASPCGYNACNDVFLMDGGYRYPFGTVNTFNRYGFGWPRVRNYGWGYIRRYPVGRYWW